ncbi:ATP-grasp domain-containing protein [Archangium violaceum]|uniref:ATP-grasp domain-containing protein n=1 Tax=Archangium violaceum TaxID=83451 RepID=UPI00194F5E0F|nr:ATP-grasp domain-containing protein [Archangium violaceum]QRN95681.1 ATP-grasp domain-containing protein [Archangium violaceum]
MSRIDDIAADRTPPLGTHNHLDGTDMKKAFVLLEVMNHMALVLKEAAARGHRIVVLNHKPLRESGPYRVPRELVDELIYIESWEDRPGLQRILEDLHQRYQVVGTYAGFEGTLPYEAALREMAGLPNNGADNVRFVLDKGAVRKKLYAEGLSELKSVLLSEARHWTQWRFKGSAILKPVNGTGSALCFTVSSLEELREATTKIEEAAVIDPLMKRYILDRGEFVLEEKAEGELLSLESLVYRGAIHPIGLSSRYVLAKDPVVEMGGTFPYSHPRLDEIIAKSKAIHESMKIFHGSTHVELMVPREGPIELIDFNVRFAGIESLISFNQAFGIPYEARLTDLACDIEPDLSFLERPPAFTAEVLLLPPPGTTELQELVFPPEAVFSRLFKEIGQKLTGKTDQLDHIGSFVVKADTEAEVNQKALEARRRAICNGKTLGDNINNQVIPPDMLAETPYPQEKETHVQHALQQPVAVSSTQARVDELLVRHVARHFQGEALATLQERFQKEHLVPLRGFCPPELFESIKEEASRIVERFGVARNLVLDITDGTPRHMTTVGQPIIKDHGPLIHALYFSPVLKDILSQVVGEELFTCPYAGEHYVISRLQRSGDTHGWHWDDYTYGFVLILEAPDYRDGGFVQGVPHTSWDKKNPDVHGALLKSQVNSYAFEPGDAYILKTNTTMHRVYPIRGNGRRTIVNTTWASAADLQQSITHETNDILFGGTAPGLASNQ